MPPTSDSVLVGIFDDARAAQAAMDEMRRFGIDGHDVAMMIRGTDVSTGGEITDAAGAKDGSGAVNGVLIGALGGALAGIIGGLLLRGGPDANLAVIGILAGAAGAGAAVGGILGAMIGLRLSEREAEVCQKKFYAGRAILTVTDTAHAQGAREVMAKHGGYDVRTLPVSAVPSPGRLLAQVLFEGA